MRGTRAVPNRLVAVARRTQPLRPAGFYAPWLWATGLVLTGSCLWRRSRRYRGIHAIYAGCVVLIMVALTVSCGGGNSGSHGGSAGTTYTITITGTSGSLQHSTSVSLIVQ